MRKLFDYSKFGKKGWDKAVINYIGLIHEFKGRQDLYLSKKPAELEKLVEISKIQSTEASNAIEGIITTNQRLKQILSEKITPRNRDEKEIKGYRYALNIVHENYDYIPINSNYILQLHKEIFQFSDVLYGGNFKNTPNEIVAKYPDGRKEVIFKPLDLYEIPEAMEALCIEYDNAINKLNIDPLIVIPIFIHDFLCIHPFNDGNGRISRLLTTLLLYKNGYMIGKYISLEKKIQITKDDYYDALKESGKDWIENNNDDTAFVKYLLGIILSAYRDFEKRVDLIGEKQSAREIVEKVVKSKIGKFTKTDILEMCPMISKASVEKSLKEMCDEGLIRMEGKGRASYYYIDLA